MKNLILLIILFSLFSCSSLKEKYYKEGYKQGVLEGEVMTKKKGYSNYAILNQQRIYATKLNLNDRPLDIDPQLVLSSLSQCPKNPKVLDKTIIKIDSMIFDYVAASLELNRDAKEELNLKLQQSYPHLSASIRQQYLDKIKTLNKNYNSSIDVTRNITNAKLFSEVMASNLCSFSTLILVPMKINLSLAKDAALGYLTQDPCTVLLTSLLEPLSKKIINAAVIQDIEETKHEIEVISNKAIAELATAQMSFIERETKKASKINMMGLLKSEGILKMEFSGLYKAGFDLSNNIKVEINHDRKVINLILSKPIIFPPSITPNIKELDEGWGWVKDIGPEDYDILYQQAKQKMTWQAENSDLKLKATKNAEFIIKQFYSPFLAIPEFDYTIKISTF